MTDGQLNIFDALAALDPSVVVTMEPEPAWVWARCGTCAEVRYIRRSAVKTAKCSMTPHCPGPMEAYLSTDCEVCGKPVTARRRAADVRFCSKKCEGEAL